MTDFASLQRLYSAHFDAIVGDFLPDPQKPPQQLAQAMRYSVMAGGKRLRPMLCFATASALGLDYRQVNAPAVALELIHTYSLIHDDLPAMDNDQLRRGMPTCHIAFGEATAILAGDALLTLAFEILSAPMGVDAATQLQMLQLLAKSAGASGMIQGQQLDIGSEGKNLDLTALSEIHRHKTGDLIRAAVALGALAAISATDSRYASLCLYAEHIGMAFQIQDDVLDVIGSSARLGKTQGKDAAAQKNTYVRLLGLQGAQQAAAQHCQQALDCLAGFENASALTAIAQFIIQRDH